MDYNQMCEGTTLYLPVYAPGGAAGSSATSTLHRVIGN